MGEILYGRFEKMEQFCMEIAGFVGQIRPLFESTRMYFQNYLTEKKPDFTASVTREELDFEQEALRREAQSEGMRIRTFTDPFLERAAIQRKFSEFLLTKDTLLLHGSTVAVDGKGYLFTAKCGTGKSTHTRLWKREFGDRAVMINDDKPFVKVTRQGVLVCGSPWSGKHGLDANLTVPLQGICILQRGTENRIAGISPAEAMPMLLHQSVPPLEESRYPAYRALVDRLAEGTGLWKMECNKEPRAAWVSYRAMSGEEAGEET